MTNPDYSLIEPRDELGDDYEIEPEECQNDPRHCHCEYHEDFRAAHEEDYHDR